MDPNQFLTGPELEVLYFKDKTNECFHEPENVRSLLTHVLNKDMGELTNSDFEIIEFCNARIHPEGFPDTKKLQFMHDKFAMIEKEKEKKRFCKNIGKIAACFVFIVMGGVLAFAYSGMEAEAGIFDWVRSLFIEEDGEQLVISTPDASMAKIEMVEGHLPDRLPETFTFSKSRTSESTLSTLYLYIFSDSSNRNLTISIKDFHDSNGLYQHTQEITKNSTQKNLRNDICYYYGTNNNNNYITWICDTSVYTLTGQFSLSTLETIFSLYN